MNVMNLFKPGAQPTSGMPAAFQNEPEIMQDSSFEKGDDAPDLVLPQLKINNKKQLLQELSKRAAALTGMAEEAIFTTLLERERLGSTGIGKGIAIPHGKLEGLTRVYSIFVRLERPIPFDAVDEQPVDLIYMLLAPAHAGADHLKALAKVSRLLRNAPLCEKMRGAETEDAILALIHASETKSAA